MQPDAVEVFRGGLIQHGPGNDRVYLMRPPADIPGNFPAELISLGRRKGYSKIFARVAASVSGIFLAQGFREEAAIPSFSPEGEAMVFLGYYLKAERRLEKSVARMEEILAAALGLAERGKRQRLPAGLRLRRCRERDITGLAELYRRVFVTYPFPIHDPAYLRETLAADVDYFLVCGASGPVAASAAEIAGAAVEMTDFATLPRWRRRGLGALLLERMEAEMRRKKLRTAFTIARALSLGMNTVFARAGYRFGGRLRNNTQIAGRIESMNVWHKFL